MGFNFGDILISKEILYLLTDFLIPILMEGGEINMGIVILKNTAGREVVEVNCSSLYSAISKLIDDILAKEMNHLIHEMAHRLAHLKYALNDFKDPFVRYLLDPSDKHLQTFVHILVQFISFIHETVIAAITYDLNLLVHFAAIICARIKTLTLEHLCHFCEVRRHLLLHRQNKGSTDSASDDNTHLFALI